MALGLGALVLLPSLGLLYSLLLRGRLDEEPEPRSETSPGRTVPRFQPLLPVVGTLLVVGVVATFAVQPAWGRIIGVPCLLAFVALAFLSIATAMTATASDGAAADSGQRVE